MTEPYKALVFGVQAVRRQVDRDARALGGALGVAAKHLPHQVGNVARVLSAPRVRHLLADEVGMGKTIQALMILNALRLQDPELSALIVVPDALREQWRDEHLTRAHHSLIEGAPQPLDERRVRLAWPAVLQAGDIDPSQYGALIVDEFHSLTAPLQRRILATAPEFTHLLLISATPPFQDPQRLGEVMGMLEPGRVTVQDEEGEGVAEQLVSRERQVTALLDGLADEEGWEALGGAPPAAYPESAAAQAHCWLRTVIRTRRSEFREYMPLRRHLEVTVEPVDAEVERQRLMWRYFHHLSDLTREFDLDLLAQRVIRSPASLRQRVTYLRGHGHEREGLLEEVDPLLSSDLGDSRLDALCDLLAALWYAEPDAKVLVAAGDNLTVDDLYGRLPLILDQVGPPGEERELQPARIRNQTRGATSLVSDDDQTADAVRSFVSGDANLLLAADVGKLGLNLQVTRHIVLYSIPWDPHEVEQWIGRVDRIGNVAANASREEPLPIVVHTICQRGLVDERIVEVMKATSILERSVSLDSAAVEAVRESIRRAALGRDLNEWVELLRSAEALRGAELEELDAPLFASLPWTSAWSKALFERLDGAPPLRPAIAREGREGGMGGREEAMMGWVFSLRSAAELDVRGAKEADRRPRSMGHVIQHRPEARGRDRYLYLSSLRFSQELTPHPSRPVYFYGYRWELSQPPRREYLWRDTEPNPVYFLDHGSPLHEELVGGWAEIGRRGEEWFTVLLPKEHPALQVLRDKVVAIWVGEQDPAQLLGDVGALIATLGDGAAALVGRWSTPLLSAPRHADERFLRHHLERALVVVGVEISGAGELRGADQAACVELLCPGAAGDPMPRSYAWERPPAVLLSAADAAWARLEGAAADRARQRWSTGLPRLGRALRERAYVLGVDEHDARQRAEAARRPLLEELGALDSVAELTSSEKGRQTRLRRELEELDAGERARRAANELRLSWLDACMHRAGSFKPTPYRRAVVRVKEAR
ncbi:MAG: DEAD/DEAH box helicase [Alphaproteobacteria bacterium]|nr:DEAD/DEAH box helicase [Alphaproteobacteria bacterium]